MSEQDTESRGWRFVGYLLGAMMVGASFGGIVMGAAMVDTGRVLVDDGEGGLDYHDDDLIYAGVLVSGLSMTLLVLGGLLVVNSMRSVTLRSSSLD